MKKKTNKTNKTIRDPRPQKARSDAQCTRYGRVLSHVDQLFQDGRAIDAALKEAARDARRLHKALGNPMVTWENGQVVWVQPEDIKIDDDSE
jgi:hypothetical protein